MIIRVEIQYCIFTLAPIFIVVGNNSADSFPTSFAALASNTLTVGSSPNTPSSTGAAILCVPGLTGFCYGVASHIYHSLAILIWLQINFPVRVLFNNNAAPIFQEATSVREN